MTLGIYFARGSTGGVGKLALGHGGSTCCRKPRDHLCGPCSIVFILGLRLKGQQLAGRSSFPGCVGGTGENTHLRLCRPGEREWPLLLDKHKLC